MELLGVICGVWLAYEIHIGNKVVIDICLILMSIAILVGYPYLALSGIISVHSVAGQTLFYTTFLMSYACAIPTLVTKIKYLLKG